MRIGYFTGGTVGAGHLVRALAIKRGLERAGHVGEFRAFGPDIPFPVADQKPYEKVPVEPEELTNPFTAPESHLAHRLTEYRPELLIVDMFWTPLMYLLPLEACEHWLLIRKCPDIWLEGTENIPFDPTLYHRIIAFEPIEHRAFTHRVEPIVICNPDECKPPGALRSMLNVPDGNRLAVVAHAGNKGEVHELVPMDTAGKTVVQFDLREEQAPFPIAEWLNGADEIYSGAGYNSFWESRWLRYHDRIHFTPFGRHIDDQQWRLEQCGDYVLDENGADQLARWIV